MTRYVIQSLGHQGDGVFTLDGRDVFAPFTLPGEVVKGDIVGDRLSDVKIIEPSENRIKPACQHFKTCGGCATQHIRDEVLAEWKLNNVRNELSRHGLKPMFRPIETSPPRSRRRAVFSARRTRKGAMIGFHGRKSEVLVDLLDCTLVHPDILAAFNGLKALTRIGASRSGEIKISVTTSSGGLDLDLHDCKPLTPALTSEIVKIAQSEKFARVAWNGEVVLELQPALQKMGTALVRPPAGGFLQATPEGEATLVSVVLEAVSGAKKIVDLFAGCGTLSLPIAAKAEVHAVEGDGEMLSALDTGWRQAFGMRRVSTETRDLFRRPLLIEELNYFDAAILDPPRAGAKAQVQLLAASAIPTIVYVSCNPATFARDAEILLQGGYQLDWVQVVDQFRWSAHCELAGCFTRAKDAGI